MQRKTDKKNVYNAGKNCANQDLVFQHMSSHYRRILNAKKTVDTSPPYCFKAKRASGISQASNKGTKALISRNASPALTERSLSTNSCKGSCWGAESFAGSSRYHVACIQETEPYATIKYTCVDMDLIDRITFDTKNGPSAYCDEGWMEIKAQQNEKLCKPRYSVKEGKSKPTSALNPKRRLPPKDKEFKQKRKFSIQEKTPSTDSAANLNQYLTSNKVKCNPRVVKKEAASKLRSLRVYHPPRRKERIPVKAADPVGCSLETPKCKCTNICLCESNDNDSEIKKTLENPKESQTSSRDSAYNGGISSLPESRSPTPDQRRKKECSCDSPDGNLYCEKTAEVCKRQEEIKETDFYTQTASEENELKSSSPATPCTKFLDEDPKESLRQLKEDAVYIKFIQDITVEILEKNLYTNKALKKVMKRHVIKNLDVLDKERMLKEVENLRIQLGVPEDKDLFNFDLEVVESYTNLANPRPTISDSQFVLSKDLDEKITNKQTNEVKKETTENAKIVKSISEVLEKKVRSERRAYNYECEKNYAGSVDDDDDDDEIISVIQVTKAIREKKNRKVEECMDKESRGNSADESDQSLDCKIRTKKLSMKQEVLFGKCFESSSSSSDTEEKTKRCMQHVRENMDKLPDKNSDERNEYLSESIHSGRSFSSILDKKNRSVSFRNNQDLKMCEIKEIEAKKL